VIFVVVDGEGDFLTLVEGGLEEGHEAVEIVLAFGKDCFGVVAAEEDAALGVAAGVAGVDADAFESGHVEHVGHHAAKPGGAVDYHAVDACGNRGLARDFGLFREVAPTVFEGAAKELSVDEQEAFGKVVQSFQFEVHICFVKGIPGRPSLFQLQFKIQSSNVKIQSLCVKCEMQNEK